MRFPSDPGAAAIADRHFAKAPDIIARKQPGNPARHIGGGPRLLLAGESVKREAAPFIAVCCERIANAVKCLVRRDRAGSGAFALVRGPPARCCVRRGIRATGQAPERPRPASDNRSRRSRVASAARPRARHGINIVQPPAQPARAANRRLHRPARQNNSSPIPGRSVRARRGRGGLTMQRLPLSDQRRSFGTQLSDTATCAGGESIRAEGLPCTRG